MSDRQFGADDYTVGWVCALPLEMAAARGMVDEVHRNLVEQASGDHNNYVLGQIAGHNVVVACLPAGIYGMTPAATVAKDMLRTFKSIRFGLMVGIGGGAPSSGHDIRLGDIVVSQPSGTSGGVIQYDRGKDRPETFERTGSLNTPPQLLLSALSRLQADHLMQGSRIPGFLSELLNRYPKMRKDFSFQGELNDCLFQAEYEHPDETSGCHKCDHTKVVQRDARDDVDPVVHFGNIASGNLVIKDSNTRDRLSKELGVLCFEMEAAGLMQDFPCLVIRGICDYADSHKNKAWQGYAAAVAAAFAKELLSIISPGQVLQNKVIPQVVSDPVVQELLTANNETLSKQTMKQDTRYENDKQIECHQAFKTSRYEEFKNIVPDRVPGTCKWVLEHPQYQKWRQSSNDDILWISADPGCGKSVLAKALVDEDLGNSSNQTVCYFFFKDNEDQNSLATALCAILHQLFGRLPQLLPHAAAAFEKNGLRLRYEVDELWRILLAAATDESAGAVICVFDALDECRRDGRRKLVQLVTNFYTQSVSAPARSSSLKFLATSRPYQDIESSFSDILPALPSIRLAGEECNADISEEINLVIRQKIQELRTDQEVRDLLEAKLLATNNRTYLWLHLVWDELQQVNRKPALLKKIDSLPSTIEQAYEGILSRLRPDQQEEAHILLHIVVGARRPLTLMEMGVAFQLAVDVPDATTHEELDLDPDRVKSDIRELCGLFVFISDSRVYLIHQTAKEFLVAREDANVRDGKVWRHSLRSEVSNQIMTRVCVQYLSFRDIRDDHLRDEQMTDDACFEDFPLLEYSAANWPVHFREMDGADNSILNLVLKLYDARTERFETWLSIFWEAPLSYLDRLGLGPLHLAAFAGHIEVVRWLIQTHPVDVDLLDGKARTALHWAAQEGHSQVVKLLLEARANVNSQDSDGAKPLNFAVETGHAKIVQLLLNNGADVNGENNAYDEVLQDASCRGHTEIVKLLLEKGASINAQGGFYGNALQAAISEGHAEIAKLLLENGADVNAQGGGECYNAWHAAFYEGHVEMAKRLLEYGADFNTQFGEYCNALYAVSCRGHVEGGEHYNALYAALYEGHFEIAKLLLEYGADVNAQGGEHCNALHAAVVRGGVDIDQLLLLEGANVDALGDYVSSIMGAAMYRGHMDMIVKLLLKKGASINAADASGRTVLSRAAGNGNEAVVKLLLDAHDVDADKADKNGRTPLLWAAERGHIEVVKMLIGRGDVNIAVEDAFGCTAMQLAALNHHEEVEALLLGSNELMAEDFYGFKTLFGEVAALSGPSYAWPGSF